MFLVRLGGADIYGRKKIFFTVGILNFTGILFRWYFAVGNADLPSDRFRVSDCKIFGTGVALLTSVFFSCPEREVKP